MSPRCSSPEDHTISVVWFKVATYRSLANTQLQLLPREFVGDPEFDQEIQSWYGCRRGPALWSL